jgi:hypothetical protein
MFQRGVDRPPRFLNQPCVHMPRSQTPAGSMTPPSLSVSECGLPRACIASASHDSTPFQDSMTRPAYLLLLCFTVRLAASRAEFATGLLTGFGRVGLTPLIIPNFTKATRAPDSEVSVLNFVLAHASRLLTDLLYYSCCKRIVRHL